MWCLLHTFLFRQLRAKSEAILPLIPNAASPGKSKFTRRAGHRMLCVREILIRSNQILQIIVLQSCVFHYVSHAQQSSKASSCCENHESMSTGVTGKAKSDD